MIDHILAAVAVAFVGIFIVLFAAKGLGVQEIRYPFKNPSTLQRIERAPSPTWGVVRK